MGERVDVWIAQLDCPGQNSPVLEQAAVAGHGQHSLQGEVVFLQQRGHEVVAIAEREVALRDPPVRLGQAHFGVVEHDVEERPLGVGPAEIFDRRGRQPAAQPVPTGQVESHLRPREHPRDGAEVFELATAASTSRARGDPQPAELFDGADLEEPRIETLRLHQLAIGRARRCVDDSSQLAETVGGIAPGGAGHRGFEHRGGDLLEVPPRDRAIAVPRKDDLALLRHLEAARHRTGGLRSHRAVGGPTATAERAASAVEDREAKMIPARPRGQRRLRVVKRERRRQRPGLLGGVGVTEHDLDAPAVGGQPLAYRRDAQHCV